MSINVTFIIADTAETLQRKHCVCNNNGKKFVIVIAAILYFSFLRDLQYKKIVHGWSSLDSLNCSADYLTGVTTIGPR